MAFNITGIDEELFFTSSTVVSLSLFTVLVLPPLVLCLLCVLALLFTTGVTKKIIVSLVNIFAVEICGWLSQSVFFLGFPSRTAGLPGDYSCHFYVSSFGVGILQRFTSAALYAIMVFIFIKHEEKKMKWSIVIPFIAVSWLMALAVYGVIPYLHDFQEMDSVLFCIYREDSLVPIGVQAVVILIFLSSSLILVTCCIMIFLYIKNNTLESSVDLKRATARLLFFLLASLFFSFFGSIVPAVSEAVRDAFEGKGVAALFAVNLLLRTVFLFPLMATPIAAIVLLKPLRTALHKFCCCCKSHEVDNE